MKPRTSKMEKVGEYDFFNRKESALVSVGSLVLVRYDKRLGVIRVLAKKAPTDQVDGALRLMKSRFPNWCTCEY